MSQKILSLTALVIIFWVSISYGSEPYPNSNLSPYDRTAPSTPTNLAVNGNIHTKEVKVDFTGWADYAFKNDYQLPILAEVETHIKEKGHLINIPSAAEVEANGIQLGEMNKLLLEKIEELTLYILGQPTEIERLKTMELDNFTFKKGLEITEERIANIENILMKKSKNEAAKK